MRAVVLVLLLAAPAVAGCIQTPTSPPAPGSFVDGQARLLCFDALCNFQATSAPAARQANELSIAVNPANPLNVIATGKDYTPDEAGDCVWAGLYTTMDGGKTWTDQNVPGSPWKHESDPTTPTTDFTKFWCATDPVVAFSPDGKVAYWAVMPYQCDPASGSKTGRGQETKGGLNDWFYTCSSMYVLVSRDGGKTWPADAAKQVSLGPFIAHDKEWISVSPDGKKVTLCWDYAGDTGGGPGIPGEVPIPLPVGVPSPNAAIVCSASADEGASWTQPAAATDAGGFPWTDFGPDGKAWMAMVGGQNFTDVLVTSSADAKTWAKPVKAASFGMPSGTNEYGWPVLNGSAFRIVPYGALAVDRTHGPHAGRVYVAYFTFERGNGDVMLTWSDDGQAWSPPVRLSDDGESAHDQFLPAISVGPDGTVDASWLDRRDDPANHLYDAYYSYSLDGGVTWAKNLRVSNASSDEKHSHHQNGMVFLGDYRDMRSVRGQATIVWVDTRNQKADAFVATVLRPSADGS